ncbi:TetR/AcrR family transcriptional regulator [Winslowiella iniecta]|uniref:TetR family transcriptional regulator n=1 Tax=Winslowiella iniecta TaxID=1560201 RepID=A0A0L7T1J5_9GAMM|nr:TetR/AcrR family transcriptional regulator [Winslowiella iniecta]KOC89272.1 TetR family transcriptional regulator [Winslowiella iniecta]KOC94840.1 TetR family transcriptional regulator [Winslowiella iniecta]
MTINQDVCAKKGRGRPKLFDRETALDKALELFWAHGYEATSLADLVAATGAKAPTLYAEFENKEGLFRAAMDRYIEKFAEQRKAALACPERTVAQGIENYFRSTAACFTDRTKPAGCFFICTSTALSAASGEVAEMLRTRHNAQEATLLEFLQQRQQQGEIARATDTDGVAKYLSCVLQGMSVRAREGASREELEGIIDTVMRLWPTLVMPA